MDKVQFIQFIRNNGCRVDSRKILAMLDKVIEANFNIDEEVIEAPNESKEEELTIEKFPEKIDSPKAGDIEGFPEGKLNTPPVNLMPIEPLTEEEIQSIDNIVKTREEVDPEPKEPIIKLGHSHTLNKTNYTGGVEFTATLDGVSATGQNPVPFKDNTSVGVTLIPEVETEKLERPVEANGEEY